MNIIACFACGGILEVGLVSFILAMSSACKWCRVKHMLKNAEKCDCKCHIKDDIIE